MLKARLTITAVLIIVVSFLITGCYTEQISTETPDSTSVHPNINTAPISYAGLGTMFNTKTRQLVSEVDAFNDNNPTIILLVKLFEAPPSTRVRARWSFAKLEDEKSKNEVYVEHERVGEGNTDLLYYLYKPSQGWRKGNYKVTLLVNGEEKMTLPFKIE